MSPRTLQDVAPPKAKFLLDVLEGLSRPQKALPCKYFYDERGSQLFDRICELEEYYLTRTELEIMRAHAQEMGERLGPHCAIVEYGSGSSLKTRILLDHLPAPTAYVPVDISKSHLRSAAERMSRLYPCVAICPVCADFVQPFELPAIEGPVTRWVVYFPGSTIGNFSPASATRLLSNMARQVGSRGGLLIGVDLVKSPAILEAAYDDALGVTSEFNLNLLARINRELDGDFDLDQFHHLSFFNERRSRIEMYLVSKRNQVAHVGEAEIELTAGELIHTENSYKYSFERFRTIAARGGFVVQQAWCDVEKLFSVQYLTARGL